MKLTREQIKQMPAGAEMDYLIATKIFKARKPTPEQVAMIKIISFQFGHGNPQNHWAETVLIEPLPQKNPYTGADFEFLQPRQYSTRIDAAWLVAEKMRSEGWFFDVGDEVETPEIYARFHQQNAACLTLADTAPLAICRAALIATLGTPVNTD